MQALHKHPVFPQHKDEEMASTVSARTDLLLRQVNGERQISNQIDRAVSGPSGDEVHVLGPPCGVTLASFLRSESVLDMKRSFFLPEQHHS
jgi:SMC interacting uncharacterized protein involved in chromosome segregation